MKINTEALQIQQTRTPRVIPITIDQEGAKTLVWLPAITRSQYLPVTFLQDYIHIAMYIYISYRAPFQWINCNTIQVHVISQFVPEKAFLFNDHSYITKKALLDICVCSLAIHFMEI